MYLYSEITPKRNQMIDFLKLLKYTRVSVNYIWLKNTFAFVVLRKKTQIGLL